MQHACGIDDNIVLPVIDESLDTVEYNDNISSIASRDILPECRIDGLIARDVLDAGSKLGFVLVQEGSERFVKAVVVPEVEDTDVPHVDFGRCVVVCQEVEEVCRLLVFPIVDVDDCVRLEPGAHIAEFAFHDTNGPEEGVVVVDLVDRVSPAITDAHTGQSCASGSDEGLIFQDLSRQVRNVVAGKRLACDVKRAVLQTGELVVEVVEEVNEVVSGLLC